MSVTLLKCLLPLACAVHLALLYCDRIITLLDGGQFDFRLLNNKKLSAVMGATPTERPMRSMVLGAFAMTAAMPAYLALGAWVLPQCLRTASSFCCRAWRITSCAARWSGFICA